MHIEQQYIFIKHALNQKTPALSGIEWFLSWGWVGEGVAYRGKGCEGSKWVFSCMDLLGAFSFQVKLSVLKSKIFKKCVIKIV